MLCYLRSRFTDEDALEVSGIPVNFGPYILLLMGSDDY